MRKRVTPIDSVATAGQWSAVKATEKGTVNGQSGSEVPLKYSQPSGDSVERIAIMEWSKVNS